MPDLTRPGARYSRCFWSATVCASKM